MTARRWLFFTFVYGHHNIVTNVVTNVLSPPPLQQDVTFFFSDVVGFTGICRQLYPWQVIEMLNQLYSVCDFLATKMGIFKIETIGKLVLHTFTCYFNFAQVLLILTPNTTLTLPFETIGDGEFNAFAFHFIFSPTQRLLITHTCINLPLQCSLCLLQRSTQERQRSCA